MSLYRFPDAISTEIVIFSAHVTQYSAEKNRLFSWIMEILQFDCGRGFPLERQQADIVALAAAVHHVHPRTVHRPRVVVVAPAGAAVNLAVHKTSNGLMDVLVGEAEETRHA